MLKILTLPIAFAVFAVAACSSTAGAPARHTAAGQPLTEAYRGRMAPVPRPLLRQLSSMTVKDLRTGRESQIQIERFGNGIRAREPDGCIWTKAISWFAPSDSYAQCGRSSDWRQATAQVLAKGDLFPLKVGAKASYERRAVSHTGKKSNRRVDCKVVDTATVVRPGNIRTAAYVVTCDDGRMTRTTWYAPKEGPVAYTEVHRKAGVRDAWVRVR